MLVLAAMMAGVSTVSSRGAIVTKQYDSTTAFGGPGEIAPATDDLLSGIIQTGSAFSDQEGLGTDTTSASLTNGRFGPAGLTPPPGPNPEVAIVGTNQTMTFTLGNGPNGQGYSVSEFRSYSGWQDSGRARQDFTLTYSTVAAPDVFIPLATFDGTANAQDELTVVTDDAGAVIPNVYAIQFKTPAEVQNGYVGYREFDLIGTGTGVPEPATVGVIGVGGLALLGRRRRRAV